MPLVSMRMTLSALFLFIIAGCGDPGLDGTSEETFQASLATLKAPLSEPEQQRLDQILEGFEFLFSDNVIGVLDNSENVKNRIRSRLDGLTAEELIEEWNQRLDKAITTLEEKKEKTDMAMEQLKDVVVKRAEYYIQRKQSVAKLTIHNKTEHKISKVYFHGILKTRGRRKVLVEDDFNYNIRHTEGKDLDPDESATWNFALLSSVWRKAPKDVDNIYLNVVITRIDGEPEVPIYDAYTHRFSTKDSKRLEALVAYRQNIKTDGPAMTQTAK
jgi:hypothetical protein